MYINIRMKWSKFTRNRVFSSCCGIHTPTMPWHEHTCTGNIHTNIRFTCLNTHTHAPIGRLVGKYASMFLWNSLKIRCIHYKFVYTVRACARVCSTHIRSKLAIYRHWNQLLIGIRFIFLHTFVLKLNLYSFSFCFLRTAASLLIICLYVIRDHMRASLIFTSWELWRCVVLIVAVAVVVVVVIVAVVTVITHRSCCFTAIDVYSQNVYWF